MIGWDWRGKCGFGNEFGSCFSLIFYLYFIFVDHTCFRFTPQFHFFHSFPVARRTKLDSNINEHLLRSMGNKTCRSFRVDIFYHFIFHTFSFIFHHFLRFPIIPPTSFQILLPPSAPSLKPLWRHRLHLLGRRGVTPLAFAAGNGHSAAVRALLAAKAEVDAAEKRGREPQSRGAVGLGELVPFSGKLEKREKVWRFVCEGNYFIS